MKVASWNTSDIGNDTFVCLILYARLLTHCFDVGMKREKESNEFQLQALTVVIECLYSFVEINNSTRDEKSI